jgi:hypothetical protein
MKRTRSLTSRSLPLTALSLDYFHVWSDGSNDAGVSQTSDANGVKATFQRTIGDHWIFALPFVFQETNASGSSLMGPNSSTADSYLLYPFVVFKTPLKITTSRCFPYLRVIGWLLRILQTSNQSPQILMDGMAPLARWRVWTTS